jgi:flagellar FliL protein
MAEKKGPETEPDVVEEVQKGGKGKLILIVVVVLVLMSGVAGAYVFRSSIPYLNHYFPKQGENDHQESTKKKAHPGPILPLDPFIFNLGGSQTKFAKVSIAVEMVDAKVMERAKGMIPVIRDGVLSVLGSKSPESLLEITQRDKIKKEIHDSLKALFPVDNSVQAVYITDLVIQ